jgi:transcriptional regulator with XRE-family HTH domain
MVEASFTRKKIESLTLGEKLRKLRNETHIPLSEVSRATRIRVKYLELLESGEYAKLPADVYVRGFLRNYARFLGVDEVALMKLYERERNIQANMEGTEDKPKKKIGIPMHSIVITSRTVVLTVAGILILAVFGYLYKEFRSFASEPRLVILEPASGSVVNTSEIILRGKTDKGARVSVNGEASFVGSEGDFSEKMTLQSGMNSISIVAINRFEKAKTETLTLEANFAQATSPDSEELKERAENDKSFSLEVSVKKATTITVTADDAVVQNGLLEPNTIRKIEAKNEIKITTSNALNTVVKKENGEEGVLGETEKPAKDIVFTEAGRQENEEGVQ